MPVTRCFFCRRKIGKRKRGKLAYEDIYARDPSLGYLVCIDCFEALETSIRKVRLRQIDESNEKLEARAGVGMSLYAIDVRARYENRYQGTQEHLEKIGCEKCNNRGYAIIDGVIIPCECRGDARAEDELWEGSESNPKNQER